MRVTTCAVCALLLLGVFYEASDSQSNNCNGNDGVDVWMGDGACDPQNLIPECDWDGGDCCKCTCVNEKFACGTDGYLCVDPDVPNEDLATCEESLPSPCPVEIKRKWSVENTTQARTLAETVNCTGGTFEVEWNGIVVVDTEIAVMDGTVLSISGVGSSAVIDGGRWTRLFRVVNASLHLNNVGIRNGNATFGGAIAAIGSTLALNRTSFSLNTAYDKDGGAVSAYGGSNLSFVEETKFCNNSSNNYGGALYVMNSSVSWHGVSSFFGNSATQSGGAVCAVFGSIVTWEAETTFRGNSADSYHGGALLLESSSNASWSENVSFVGNIAHYEGGAIFVDHGSDVSWSGGATFSGNTAIYGAGGAMLIADLSSVSWSGETVFMFNSAGSQGGAVSSRALDSIDETSYLSMSGSICFSNNTCGSNGGGFALLGGLSVSIKTDDIAFIGNNAGTAGGAVFISVNGMGPIFTNVAFLFNSAEAGGGVFITGIGASFEPTVEEWSATFDGCRFIGNKAGATGGGIEITTGSAGLTNTLFKSNVAGLGGGALRLAGATSLNGCAFEANLSGVGSSPAILMTGTIIDMQRCSFRRNAYDCNIGTFLDESTTGERFTVVCSGCDDCDNCTVEMPENVPTCLAVIEHSTSQGGNLVNLETLSIEAGYWRATSKSTTVLACYKEDACAGGLTGSPDYCTEGYTGPYCSICTEKYSRGSGFTCTKCSDNVWGKTAAAVAAVVTVVIVVFAFTYIISVERAGARSGITARVLRRVPLHSVKIIIVAWQILTQFATVADVTYPGIYQNFLNVVDILNFDPTWMLSAGCLADVDYHARFLIVTVGPILIMLILIGTYSYVKRRHHAKDEIRQTTRHKHVSAVLFILFLVYSSTSSMVFQMFDCDGLDDGNDYLRADYTIQCDGPRHRALMIYAGFMILVYPLGVPAVFAFFLLQNRRLLLDKVARKDALDVTAISDLWEPYKPSRYYYEVVECGRRIVLMGVVIVIDDESAAQIAVTLMLAIVFMIMSEVLAPYESEFDAWVSRLGHAVVVFSMYFALLLKVDVSEDSQESQKVFELMLIVIHVIMILAVIAETVLTGFSMQKGQVEDPRPRYRGYKSQRYRFGCRLSGRISPSIPRSFDGNTIEGSTLVHERSAVSSRSASISVVAPPQLVPVRQQTQLI